MSYDQLYPPQFLGQTATQNPLLAQPPQNGGISFTRNGGNISKIIYSKAPTHWLAVILVIGALVDYGILWSRLPSLYAWLLAGSLPLTMAYIWSVHKFYNTPGQKTLGMLLGISSVVYFICVAITASKIPKQICINEDK